jgi:hypothetical protein
MEYPIRLGDINYGVFLQEVPAWESPRIWAHLVDMMKQELE